MAVGGTVRTQAERVADLQTTLAGQAATILHLLERMAKHEETLSSLRNWMMGVLASSVGTLLVLLWQTLPHGK